MSQTFLDLPLELLPVIMQQLVRPSHFAALCLVNRSFYRFAVPYLYERAFIYAWHKEGKAKVGVLPCVHQLSDGWDDSGGQAVPDAQFLSPPSPTCATTR